MDIEQAVERAAEFGGGPERIWSVPEGAAIRPGSGKSIFDGMTISAWVDSFDRPGHWSHDG